MQFANRTPKTSALMQAKLYHSKAWLKLQRSKGKTIAEIANMCGVSYQMIDIYLTKFNLK
jgi:transposase